MEHTLGAVDRLSWAICLSAVADEESLVAGADARVLNGGCGVNGDSSEAVVIGALCGSGSGEASKGSNEDGLSKHFKGGGLMCRRWKVLKNVDIC